MSARFVSLVLVIGVALISPCYGHFAWLKSTSTDAGPQAVFYFSEAAHMDGDRMPERVGGAAKVSVRYAKGSPQAIELELVEKDGRVDKRATIEDKPSSITLQCDYGVYQGSLLTYFAEHLRGAEPPQWAEMSRTEQHKLDLVVTRDGDKLVVDAYYQGRPWPGIEIEVTDAQNRTQKNRTDQAGQASFPVAAAGLVGVRGHYVDEDAEGQVDSGQYRGAQYYSTLTLEWTPSAPQTSDSAETLPTDDARLIPPLLPTLPEPIASFGAVVHDHYLYVYGGHTGREHQHSRDNLSNHFRRCDLRSGIWESLPTERPVQGLALVAHGKYIYRIGGMEALNAAGEPADMHSSDDFSRFDTQTRKWESMPSLPHGGRSSHDAVVAGDKLYVLGGWKLEGDSEGTWHDTGLVMDLTHQPLTWEALPKQPSRRRALAVAERDGCIYALCGISDSGDIERSVDVWDTSSQSWKSGPTLPGEGMNGFGVTAWNLNGELYISGYNGVVYRLADDGSAWEEAARLEKPRFFHRLLPYGDRGLLAVGGASRQGHIETSEFVSVGNLPE